LRFLPTIDGGDSERDEGERLPELAPSLEVLVEPVISNGVPLTNASASSRVVKHRTLGFDVPTT
jgi:hypothetical protein